MCDKCKDTGLIPFVNNDGKVIPHCWVDCGCRQPEPEHYQALTPADFDFPMSNTFRAWAYEFCGMPDPGYIPTQPEIKTELPQDLSEKLNQIEADLSGLKKRSHIHDQPKSGIKKTKYKGLEIGRA